MVERIKSVKRAYTEEGCVWGVIYVRLLKYGPDINIYVQFLVGTLPISNMNGNLSA